MGIPVLLVATTTSWFGTARIPRVLAEAGFDVSLLTPRQSLAEASRFVAKIGHLADHSTAMQWFEAFAAMVRATAPRLVIPCDDMAFRLLASLVIEPPQRMRADLQLQLAALVRAPLGDPRALQDERRQHAAPRRELRRLVSRCLRTRSLPICWAPSPWSRGTGIP